MAQRRGCPVRRYNWANPGRVPRDGPAPGRAIPGHPMQPGAPIAVRPADVRWPITRKLGVRLWVTDALRDKYVDPLHDFNAWADTPLPICKLRILGLLLTRCLPASGGNAYPIGPHHQSTRGHMIECQMNGNRDVVQRSILGKEIAESLAPYGSLSNRSRPRRALRPSWVNCVPRIDRVPPPGHGSCRRQSSA